jgi:hypothetical protein
MHVYEDIRELGNSILLWTQNENPISSAIFAKITIFDSRDLWCSAFKHHQLCVNSFPPSDLILNFFPLAEMILSPRGTKPLEGFLFGSKLNE